MAGSEGRGMVRVKRMDTVRFESSGLGVRGWRDRGGRVGLGVGVCVLVYNHR